eukprot:TRINITY_DN514_c12_g1_i1.p1 TRINITY_DN514_c12_g1~~TRINITY_DN514_c12_g1_i1.p1  ORF type:complete len:189 (+),score=51.20 TRINITY_DN514_c12_g1_i1:54-620(+)
MSKSGKVISWRGPFGFAEMENGNLVYIHTSEIDEGKLRIGLTVNFDTEEVDGHGGKLKGTNVSGEAVLAKGAKLTDEERAADKERIGAIKEASKEANKKDFDPVFEKVSKLNKHNKVQLVHRLIKDLGLGSLEKPQEKRRDPTQAGGATYTKAEFIEFYGPKKGINMWNLSSGKKGGKRAPKKTKKSE